MKLQWPFRREQPPPHTDEAKGLTFIPASAAADFGARLPGSNINYAAEVNNGMSSSVVTSALCWMMRTFPEAPVIVQRTVQERWENVAGHAMAKLIRQPNPEYDGLILWMSTILDFCFGEAFWFKVRNGRDEVVELWWIPRNMVTPQANPKNGALDFYLYQPGYIAPRDMAPRDVVHFRFGIDPRHPLRGFSPLASIMREVYTDDQAAAFTAAILKNMGVYGAVFTPESGTIPPEQAAKLKDYIQTAFTGDNRGKAMIFTNPMKAQLLQLQLQSFDVGPIRDVSEERVCAALGIPAAVIGFGTGLQQTKVGATMREMIKLAWQGGIEPLQRIVSGELDRSLLPEFQSNAAIFRSHFDTSQVEALTETPAEQTDRVVKLVDANIIKVAQAQRELGYPVDPSQDKYKRDLEAAAKPKVDPLPGNRVAGLLGAPENENGNGNGKQPEESANA